MCGIAGILNLTEPLPIDEEVLFRMLYMIRHRGPEESGIYVDSHVGLGHNRLSIIGLEGGTQPIGNEDSSLWIVYNGEAFNYIELKAKLVRNGHTFATETDSEVVLHLYEEFGADCLSRINGQFALAIWDRRKKALFLARDRLGIRPLFYTRLKNQFIFSSEIKSLFMFPDIHRVIDVEALQQIFTFWTTITPKTVFENIEELPPGSYMVVRNGSIRKKTYWKIPHCTPEARWKGSFEEAREALEEILLDAVRIRLRADVPVGAYLSGGLDSSLTSAIISRHFDNRLKTYSIGFEEKDFDESGFQKQMVSYLGTEHQQTLALNEVVRDRLSDVVWHCEKPILRTAPVPLFLLSKLVHDNGFKVVLTGEGADEIFGGYNIFKEAKIRAFWGKSPASSVRPLLLEKLYPYIFKNPSRSRAFLRRFYGVATEDLPDPFFSHKVRWQNSSKNCSFFSNDLTALKNGYNPMEEAALRLPHDFGARDVFAKAQFLEMDIFLSNYLLSSQGDRPAMANSLEMRLPFLDYRVIDFADKLPTHWKINGLNEKYILKRSFTGLLPDSIRNRTKQPYRAPISRLFCSETSNEFLDHLLSEEYLKKVGLFNHRKVLKLLEKFRRPARDVENEVQNMGLVGILTTQIVYHQFIDHFPWKPVEPIRMDKAVRFV